MQKLLLLVSSIGLVTSLCLMAKGPVAAEAAPSGQLSAAEMRTTKGSGMVCTKSVCSGTSGCKNQLSTSTSTRTTYYPHYQCESGGVYEAVCNNINPNQDCVKTESCDATDCYGTCTTSTTTISICGN